MKRIIKKVRLNSIRYVDLERDPLQWWIKSVRRIKKAKTFPSCGSVAVMALSRTISYLVVNSIFGLLVLALAKFLGLPVPINWITVLICALAGIPGAVLVILLYWLGIVIPIIIP